MVKLEECEGCGALVNFLYDDYGEELCEECMDAMDECNYQEDLDDLEDGEEE